MPSLELTTTARCPLQCTFCPQDKLKAAYGNADIYLSLANFRTILARTPPHVRIDFSGMAEPWANPDCTQMLRETLEAERSVAIYTTLYGMDDGPEVEALIRRHAAQIEVICLHLPDDKGNMRGWKNSPEYEANLVRFLALRPAVPRLEVMTMSNDGRLAPELARFGIYLGQWIGHTRAGNLDDVPGQKVQAKAAHTGPVVCSFTPFYDQSVVFPDGSVVVCCMDYGREHVVGNLLEQDYYSIFSGPEMGGLRAENMRHGGSTLCHSCNRATPLGTGVGQRLMWGVVG